MGITEEEKESEWKSMKTSLFEVPELLKNFGAFDTDGWQEFFKNSSLRVGLYVLPPNGKDTQGPHAQDEIYYVLEGKGTLLCETTSNKERLQVKPGSVLFVARETLHWFEDFPEGLKLLVFFSQA